MVHKALFTGYNLKGFRVRNRIVLPPMVCFGYSDESGTVSSKHLEHYSSRSESGPGIVITEATSVLKEGRAALTQLGIWSDEHVKGLSEIPVIVKSHGAVSILQLHHAGLVSPRDVNSAPAGPSADESKPASRALDKAEISGIREAFIGGAVRARKAGFDGIELHGAHGYLLNQFATTVWNHRTDEFGGSFQNLMRLATEIISGIRENCGDGFILGYRLGANTPLLEDGVNVALDLESLGVDYLHVSHGGSVQNLPRPPRDFDYNWIVYSGVTIKQKVKLPVMVVNEIKTPDRAAFLIESGQADFVSIGRPQLADPHWVSHMMHGEEINACLSCKPRCRWFETSDLCPARKKLKSSSIDFQAVKP